MATTTTLLLRSQDRDVQTHPDWRDFSLVVPASLPDSVLEAGEVLAVHVHPPTTAAAYLSVDLLDDKEVLVSANRTKTARRVLLSGSVKAPAVSPQGVVTDDRSLAQPAVTVGLTPLTTWSVTLDADVPAQWTLGQTFEGGDNERLVSYESNTAVVAAQQTPADQLEMGGVTRNVVQATLGNTDTSPPLPNDALQLVQGGVAIRGAATVSGYTLWGTLVDGAWRRSLSNPSYEHLPEPLLDLTWRGLVVQDGTGLAVGQTVTFANGEVGQVEAVDADTLDISLEALPSSAFVSGTVFTAGSTQYSVTASGEGLGVVAPDSDATNDPGYALQQLDIMCSSRAAPPQRLVTAANWCAVRTVRHAETVDVAVTRSNDFTLTFSTDQPWEVGDVVVTADGARFPVTSVPAPTEITVSGTLPADVAGSHIEPRGTPKTGATVHTDAGDNATVLATLRVDKDTSYMVLSAPVVSASAFVSCGAWTAQVLVVGGDTPALVWRTDIQPSAARCFDVPFATPASVGAGTVLRFESGGTACTYRRDPFTGVARVQTAEKRGVNSLPADSDIVLARSDGTVVGENTTDGPQSTDANGQIQGVLRSPRTGTWWYAVPQVPQGSVSDVRTSLVVVGADETEAVVCCQSHPVVGQLFRNAQRVFEMHRGSVQQQLVRSGDVLSLTNDDGTRASRRVFDDGDVFEHTVNHVDSFPFVERLGSDGRLQPCGNRRVHFERVRPLPARIRVRLTDARGHKVDHAQDGHLTVTVHLTAAAQ